MLSNQYHLELGKKKLWRTPSVQRHLTTAASNFIEILQDTYIFIFGFCPS